MQFSQDTEAILTYLDNSVPNGLRKRSDLGALLEIGAGMGAAREFNAMVFTGKAVWNLFASMRRAAGRDTEALQREFASNINTLREMLLPFAAHAPEDVRERFEKIYLGTSDGTLRNLVDLSFDLAQVKDIQSEQRHNTDRDTPM